MVFDRSEHEPEEWDPEEELDDPDSDSLTIPKVSTEDAGSGLGSDLRSEFGSEIETDADGVPAETDVPSELLQTFWAVVLVVNAAVLALSLGILFLLFEGPSTNSVGLIVGGIILFGFAGYRYRSYRASESDDGASTGAEANDDDTVQSSPGETPSEPASEHRSSDDPDRS
ncbi:DUF7322 domain-containing protein [Natronococcus occultus]|uniref:DUF7322 domain-containing protein n=1 Tax=Natronococcus occultus SP4 TaxID=694430 RepID=L0JXU7_9EURY|nr:hypothetical protein [Natronococcus occultus]AGB36683.1 hypothetical protein Natoc_0828 [Natronococcus occultus SP4]